LPGVLVSGVLPRGVAGDVVLLFCGRGVVVGVQLPGTTRSPVTVSVWPDDMSVEERMSPIFEAAAPPALPALEFELLAPAAPLFDAPAWPGDEAVAEDGAGDVVISTRLFRFAAKSRFELLGAATIV